MFLKVMIIIRSGEMMCLGQYILLYIDLGVGAGVHGSPFIYCLYFHKAGKIARARPMLESNSTF